MLNVLIYRTKSVFDYFPMSVLSQLAKYIINSHRNQNTVFPLIAALPLFAGTPHLLAGRLLAAICQRPFASRPVAIRPFASRPFASRPFASGRKEGKEEKRNIKSEKNFLFFSNGYFFKSIFLWYLISFKKFRRIGLSKKIF